METVIKDGIEYGLVPTDGQVEDWKPESILVLTYPCGAKAAYLNVPKIGPCMAGVVKKLNGNRPIKAEIFGEDWRVVAPELLYKWLLNLLHPTGYEVVWYGEGMNEVCILKT